MKCYQQFHQHFFSTNRCVFTLDDSSAHLSKEVEHKRHKKDYFLIVIRRVITEDVQVTNKSPLKAAYGDLEMQSILDREFQLRKDLKKIPPCHRKIKHALMLTMTKLQVVGNGFRIFLY